MSFQSMSGTAYIQTMSGMTTFEDGMGTVIENNSITTGNMTILGSLTTGSSVISNTSLGYISGSTSNLQNQIITEQTKLINLTTNVNMLQAQTFFMSGNVTLLQTKTQQLTADSTSSTFSGNCNIAGNITLSRNLNQNNNIILNDNKIYLRTPNDTNHYLGYNSIFNGPELIGYSAVRLGTIIGRSDIISCNTTGTVNTATINGNCIINGNVTASTLSATTSVSAPLVTATSMTTSTLSATTSVSAPLVTATSMTTSTLSATTSMNTPLVTATNIITSTLDASSSICTKNIGASESVSIGSNFLCGKDAVISGNLYAPSLVCSTISHNYPTIPTYTPAMTGCVLSTNYLELFTVPFLTTDTPIHIAHLVVGLGTFIITYQFSLGTTLRLYSGMVCLSHGLGDVPLVFNVMQQKNIHNILSENSGYLYPNFHGCCIYVGETVNATIYFSVQETSILSTVSSLSASSCKIQAVRIA